MTTGVKQAWAVSLPDRTRADAQSQKSKGGDTGFADAMKLAKPGKLDRRPLANEVAEAHPPRWSAQIEIRFSTTGVPDEADAGGDRNAAPVEDHAVLDDPQPGDTVPVASVPPVAFANPQPAQLLPPGIAPSKIAEAADAEAKVAPPANAKVARPVDAEIKVAPPADAEIKVAPPADAETKVARPVDAEIKVAPPVNAEAKIAPPADIKAKVARPVDAEIKVAPPADAEIKVAPADRPPQAYPSAQGEAVSLPKPVVMRVPAEMAAQAMLAQGNAKALAATNSQASAVQAALEPAESDAEREGDPKPRAPTDAVLRPAAVNFRNETPGGKAEAIVEPIDLAGHFAKNRPDAPVEPANVKRADATTIAGRVEILGQQNIPAPATYLPGPSASQLLSAIAADGSWRGAAAAADFRALPTHNAVASAHSLKIQLHPAELGIVTANLRFAGEQLTIELQVETVEAQQRLSADSEVIVKSLRALGIDIDRVTIQQPLIAVSPNNRSDANAALNGQTAPDRQAFNAGNSGSGNGQTGGQQSGRNNADGAQTSRNSVSGAPDRAGGGLYI